MNFKQFAICIAFLLAASIILPAHATDSVKRVRTGKGEIVFFFKIWEYFLVKFFTNLMFTFVISITTFIFKFIQFLFTEFGCDVSNGTGHVYCKPLCEAEQEKGHGKLLQSTCEMNDQSEIYFCYCTFNEPKSQWEYISFFLDAFVEY